MQDQTITIQLPDGKILARQDGDLIRARGVPYAVAERFQPPTPTPKWSSIKDCTRPAVLCPQLPARLEAVLGPITRGREHDENCLHVTVTAPQNAENAPVLVWLHGGAFVSGGGDLDCYQPLDLAKHGIVCVNVSYRLGVFGWFKLDGISPPNLGLLDQRAALQWVQKSISSFGGNPGNVTAVGQSAGADSIICLLVSEGGQSLFHRAILMSPPLRELRERVPTVDAVSAQAQLLLTEDPRKMSVAALLDLQRKLLMTPARPQIMLFAPALNHYPLPKESDLNQLVTERVKNIPILIGWTAHDGRPFSRLMGPQRQWYDTPIIGDYLEALGTWYVTKSYFQWPSQTFHDQVLLAGGMSTTYTFSWHPPSSPLGANHCIDLATIFGEWKDWREAAMVAGDETETKEAVQRMGQTVRNLWLGFVQGRKLKADHIVMDSSFMSPEQYFEPAS